MAKSKPALVIVLIAYAAASFFHHAHNAEFLDHYPNIGFGGYFLLRRGYRLAGLALLIGYGCYGLDALAHYAPAPASAHSLAMNLSIGLEAATALALLVALAACPVFPSSGWRGP